MSLFIFLLVAGLAFKTAGLFLCAFSKDTKTTDNSTKEKK